MGKGDKKSKRGKISIGSFGVSRSRKKKKNTVVKAEKPLKKEKKPVTVTAEITEEIKKPARKPAAKKPKKESSESAE